MAMTFLYADMRELMSEKASVRLLLEFITDSENSSVRLHATRTLAHLTREDGTLELPWV